MCSFWLFFIFIFLFTFSLHDPWVAVVYLRGSSQFTNGFGCKWLRLQGRIEITD
jgi:hypothetical protein